MWRCLKSIIRPLSKYTTFNIWTPFSLIRLIDFDLELKEEFEEFEKEMNSKNLSQMPTSTIITITNIIANILMDEFYP